MALWDGRFSNEPAQEMVLVSESMGIDLQMWREDIEGSKAHARMLADVGLQDFAINGETGYAIDEEDKEGFITTIVELLSDERRRAYLAANARQLVVEKCDRDILSKRWSDILNDLRN